MLETLNKWDTSVFLAINGWHSNFFDTVMWLTSNTLVWIPLYIIFLYFLVRQYDRRAWIILFFTTVMIVISDQASVHLFKDVFQRLRPCHNPNLQDVVHIVKGHCGGQYGFVSSHAFNIFALAVYLSMMLGKKLKYFTPLVILWAVIIGYSRVYLGVHYPGDVIVGAACGILLGWLMGKLVRYLLVKFPINTQHGI
jgi:undecaprenyl-diphosphatase